MVDFTISEIDQKILDQVRAEGKAGEKYARYYEDHEDELPPDRLPEADDFPPLMDLLRKRAFEDTPGATLQMLIAIERAASCGVSLVQPAGGLGNAALLAAGTDEQKAKWGKLLLAMSITEPETGSDTAAIRTTARLDGDEWVLNGDKIFVTSGIRADGVVVWATVDRSAGRAGIKSFLVLKGTPGFEVVRKEKKHGIRTSDTAAYGFRDCRIPRDHLLGGNETVSREPKAGSSSYRGVLQTFNMTRPFVAAGGIGKGLGALRLARDRLAQEGIEVNWDRALSERSAAEQKLIEIEAEVEAALLVTLRAAWLADKGQPNNLEASVSKAKGGDVCRTAPQQAMDLVGAMSVSHDHTLEQFMRDGRITDIYEGTGQIQRLIIARAILGYSSSDLR